MPQDLVPEPPPAPPQRTLTTVPDLPVTQARAAPAPAPVAVAAGGAAAAAVAVAAAPVARFPSPRLDAADHRSEGALLVLGLLQREGRLVDFLREIARRARRRGHRRGRARHPPRLQEGRSTSTCASSR